MVRFNGYSPSSCENKLESPGLGRKGITIMEILLFGILLLYPNSKVLGLIPF